MIEDLKHIIYNTVIESNKKLTPGEVEKAVAKACGVDRKTVKLAIKELVCLGKLSYTYLYGNSFLEKSFDRPVRISGAPIEKIPTCFSVILANLAWPTLRSLSSILSEKLEQDGILILSGFRDTVSKDLGRSYVKQGLRLAMEEIEKGWACLTFCKPAP